MNSAAVVVSAVIAFGMVTSVAAAQDVTRYRGYVLESSLESVIGTSGARAADVKTVHQRPARIQELEWRAPYVSSDSVGADPVRQIAFTFYNDALYQVIVSYDRDRTDGLTSGDLVATLAAAYGEPARTPTKTPAISPTTTHLDTTVIAQWETPATSLALVRGTYRPDYYLILISKALSMRARNAAREATRLDAAEAPQRESDQRKKDAADADAIREKNKAAFRP